VIIFFLSHRLTNLADNDTKYTHSNGNNPNEYTCDAIITDNPDIVLTCKPADCTVSMIYAEDISGKRYFAFVHAGFKGINLNLPAKVISYMKDNLSIDMSSVKIAIAPYIQKEHYIYQSLPDNLPNNASDYISPGSNGGYHIDLGCCYTKSI
jgi:copper oxidase (laccase) domain-containing protein